MSFIVNFTAFASFSGSIVFPSPACDNYWARNHSVFFCGKSLVNSSLIDSSLLSSCHTWRYKTDCIAPALRPEICLTKNLTTKYSGARHQHRAHSPPTESISGKTNFEFDSFVIIVWYKLSDLLIGWLRHLIFGKFVIHFW